MQPKPPTTLVFKVKRMLLLPRQPPTLLFLAVLSLRSVSYCLVQVGALTRHSLSEQMVSFYPPTPRVALV
jgi:hypothetical protein